jgi:hypothetical protein
MIDKVLGGILGEVRLNLLLCHSVDWLVRSGLRPWPQFAGKVVRVIV